MLLNILLFVHICGRICTKPKKSYSLVNNQCLAKLLKGNISNWRTNYAD